MRHRPWLLSGVLCLLPVTTLLVGMCPHPGYREAILYDNHSDQQRRVAYEALCNVCFQGSEQVLDIGCGTGKITANVAGRVPNGSVLGLDMHPEMISFAQNQYAPLYNNLIFTQGDASELSSLSAFDFICSFSSLHWILDHESLLARIYTALKPGGSILFTIPGSPCPEIAGVFRDLISQEPWQGYFASYHHPRRKFTIREYEQLLVQAGFNRICVNEVSFTYYFETKRDLINWFSAFSPMLSSIPKERHTDFLASLVERYLIAFPMGSDGRIVFQQKELIIQASK